MKRQSYIWATAYWKSIDGVANSQAHIKIWWIFQIMWIKTMILFHILDSNTYNKLTVVQIHMWLLWRKQNDDNDKNRNRYQFIVSAFSYHLIFLSSSIFQRKKKNANLWKRINYLLYENQNNNVVIEFFRNREHDEIYSCNQF